ncbi:hypothetical protein TOK_0697 [Pseudonocardia sp. N23]|nr:hypothetical protein TOK_0697 [Pseudonocardia sp. N23]
MTNRPIDRPSFVAETDRSVAAATPENTHVGLDDTHGCTSGAAR